MKLVRLSRLSLFACGALAALFPLNQLSAQESTPVAAKRLSLDERLAKMKDNLSLTDEQVTAIKGLFQDQQTQLTTIRRDISLTRDEKKEKSKAVIADTRTKVEAVLTDEQKAKADELRKQRAAKGAQKAQQ